MPDATGKTQIILNNHIQISRAGLPMTVINFLKEELNFLNTEFIIKKKAGKNTYNTERYYNHIQEADGWVIVPRGVIGKLLRLIKEQKIDFEFTDKRNKLPEVRFDFSIPLRKHQTDAYSAASKKDLGIIVAPPGSGKTVIGLKLIADKK